MKTILHGALIAGICLVALLWLFQSSYVLHHDLAGGMLTGALALELGAAFPDYNGYFPPAEKGWYMFANWLAQSAGIGADTAIVVLTYVATLLSASLAYVIRRRTSDATLMFFAVPLVALLVLPILYKNIFGLREPLVLLGLWPYLVLRSAGEDAHKIGPGLRIAVGLWLGLTLLFKFFFSIVVFLVETADVVANGRIGLFFRPANLISGTIVSAYLMLWLVLDPVQREVISSMRVALAASLTDPADSLSNAAYLCAIGLAVWLWLRRLGLPLQTNLIGLALVVGAVAVAWIQERWFSHHMFPILMAFVAWWWLAGRVLPRVAHPIIALALAVPVQGQFFKTAGYQVQVAETRAALGAAGISLTGKRVALLNQHPGPFGQAILAEGGMRWSPMANIAYASTQLLPLDTPERRGEFAPAIDLSQTPAAGLHGQMIDLWAEHPADIMILDHTFQWPLQHLVLRWDTVLAEDQAFQFVFDDFEEVFTHDGPLTQFTLYARAN